MKKIIIKVDTNDGDYVEKVSSISEENLNTIKPVIEAIKNFKPYEGVKRDYGKFDAWMHSHNFPTFEVRRDLGEKNSQELYGHIEGYDIFMDFVPYTEFHSIESITILNVIEEESLL